MRAPISEYWTALSAIRRVLELWVTAHGLTALAVRCECLGLQRASARFRYGLSWGGGPSPTSPAELYDPSWTVQTRGAMGLRPDARGVTTAGVGAACCRGVRRHARRRASQWIACHFPNAQRTAGPEPSDLVLARIPRAGQLPRPGPAPVSTRYFFNSLIGGAIGRDALAPAGGRRWRAAETSVGRPNIFCSYGVQRCLGARTRPSVG